MFQHWLALSDVKGFGFYHVCCHIVSNFSMALMSPVEKDKEKKEDSQ